MILKSPEEAFVLQKALHGVIWDGDVHYPTASGKSNSKVGGSYSKRNFPADNVR